MGRTLEALKRAHGTGPRPDFKIAPASALADAIGTGPKNNNEEEIPFIEVGGRELRWKVRRALWRLSVTEERYPESRRRRRSNAFRFRPGPA